MEHPARLLPLAFLLAISIGTVLLVMPFATTDGSSTALVTAVFTATSATCTTGLIVVDTPTYWSPFGHAVILGLIQVGGFGIMTLATLLGLLVSRRLGLRTKLLAQAERRTLDLGSVRGVLLRVGLTMVLCEILTAIALTLRFYIGYDYTVGQAVWHGVFHSISAFNNAGFALYGDSLERFVLDPWISLTVALAVVVGGIGFPVLFELFRGSRRPSGWSVHTRLTVVGTAILLVVGMGALLALEWSNPKTLGPLDALGKLLAGFFQSATSRTAGFNTLDYGEMDSETLLLTDVMMFIGGGSAGTAGGIKITTFLLLAYMIWAEVRGHSDVTVGHRRVAQTVQRQAVAVAFLAVAGVVAGTVALLSFTRFSTDDVLFEAFSAFNIVGLSTGITSELPHSAQWAIVMMMFVGRVGTVTVASALALSRRHKHYRLPEERPIVG